MKFVKLLTAAHVSGTLRHPHEGVLHVEDEEAERLFDNQAAEDVSADFSAKQDRETPVDQVAERTGPVTPAASDEPHQSEVAPQAADPDTKPSRRKAADHKE